MESWIERQRLEELDFEALETTARRSALQLAAGIIQRYLNADYCDQIGPHLACPVGQMARHAGRRQKRVQSALGPLELERAYYYCTQYGSGFSPSGSRSL